jgi:7-carboxy-7-deazaguanine synthase
MKVFEIFRSIQGEGRSQGYPSIFLRLAGCNLDCAWCDTRYAREGGTDMSCNEITSRISAYPDKRLCITGGEPLLQHDQLLPLLAGLYEKGYQIEIETNGTIDFRPFQPFASICMDVKCPSSGEKSDLSLLCHISVNDSIKFVVADRDDCRYAEEVLESHPVRGDVFFSPVYGSEYRTIAQFLLERNLAARLQIQLHKIIGVR